MARSVFSFVILANAGIPLFLLDTFTAVKGSGIPAFARMTGDGRHD
jgi:hypothetical protein